MQFSIQTSKKKQLIFDRDTNSDVYKFKEIETNLTKIIEYKEAAITNSLYASAVKMGIKPNIIIEFARLYGFQVDFQRDIRKRDKFQIMYEIFINENKEIIETGEILFANLYYSGQIFSHLHQNVGQF